MIYYIIHWYVCGSLAVLLFSFISNKYFEAQKEKKDILFAVVAFAGGYGTLVSILVYLLVLNRRWRELDGEITFVDTLKKISGGIGNDINIP